MLHRIEFLRFRKEYLYIMGKKKNSTNDERKDNEQEYIEMPPGWKEPTFTKEDNPHGKIYRNTKKNQVDFLIY